MVTASGEAMIAGYLPDAKGQPKRLFRQQPIPVPPARSEHRCCPRRARPMPSRIHWPSAHSARWSGPGCDRAVSRSSEGSLRGPERGTQNCDASHGFSRRRGPRGRGCGTRGVEDRSDGRPWPGKMRRCHGRPRRRYPARLSVACRDCRSWICVVLQVHVLGEVDGSALAWTGRGGRRKPLPRSGPGDGRGSTSPP